MLCPDSGEPARGSQEKIRVRLKPMPRKKTPEELIREATNAAAVSVVKAGFDAIDQLAEIGKDHLKKAILRGISGKEPAK
jgi:hypothetical protein